jgi:hypothetical protein
MEFIKRVKQMRAWIYRTSGDIERGQKKGFHTLNALLSWIKQQHDDVILKPMTENDTAEWLAGCDWFIEIYDDFRE